MNLKLLRESYDRMKNANGCGVECRLLLHIYFLQRIKNLFHLREKNIYKRRVE